MKSFGKLFREMFLYGIIGLFSATMDTLSFMLLSKGVNVPIMLANFLGVNLGIFISFYLNTYINFRKTDELKIRAFKFFCVGYLGLLISTVIMYAGINIMKAEQLYVKVFSVIIVAAIQYILNKFITFKA